jgi:hypothetical protein
MAALPEPRGIHRRIAFEVTGDLRLRFMARVSRRGADDCWPWSGAMRNGYGAIKHHGNVLGTHVVAFVIEHGAIPEGMIVTHNCDNRICCNPAHLKAGTFSDNVQEMNARRRIPAPCGEAIRKAKLTDDSVRFVFSLRRKGVSRRKIANMLGCDESTIRSVVERKTWRHVEEPSESECEEILSRSGFIK